jgi:hypothetical protein
MKTIIDAVNELRGDLNNVSHIKDDDTYHCNVNYNDDSGWWCSRGVYGDFVCTIEDFTKKALQQAKPELINGEAYQFVYAIGDIMKGIYRSMDKSFYNSNGDYMSKHCSNIELLTGGDK